ncbi:cation diffusion facilitator family transporter [Longibacter salinarum]|nr:cation diffusion facilitator family transporter [Longibacter salinarum]
MTAKETIGDPSLAERRRKHRKAKMSERRTARRRAMGLSIIVSFIMLAGKVIAAQLTGSAAIFSDAAESVVHLFATGFASFSLWYAATPPDSNHPYGHGKVAYFASAVEGVLILVAAVGIVWTSVNDLLTGAELQRLNIGLYLLAGLTAINLGLGWYLVRTGRETNSIVLVSNGQHVLTDMWTSLGVIVGVGLVWLTGVSWLDPLVALLVAGNILWTAYGLLRRSIYGLMDKADGDATQQILDVLASAKEQGLIADFHQVRHRRTGDEVWIEYHLMFPGDMTIHDAHDRSHRVEDEVDRLFPDDDVHVTAHLEPRKHDAAHPDHHYEPADPLRDVFFDLRGGD